MANVFRRDYGVFCCPHIFRNERPVLLVARDPDGYWQFLCGQEDEDFQQGHHVGVGHLLERDPTLEDMANIEISTGARRKSIDSTWQFFNLDED